MAHQLPDLPFSKDALAPHITPETLDYHYGKHHQAYVNNLNKMIADTPFENMSLEETIKKAEGGMFNNAAQIYNHSFYWNCLSPKGGGDPSGALADGLVKSFGSVEAFKAEFSQKAATLFGSGWAWLVKNSDGGLQVVQTFNAGCPLTSGQTPLLTCDVWEHAYYIDYRNARPKYIQAFWSMVHWDFVAANL